MNESNEQEQAPQFPVKLRRNPGPPPTPVIVRLERYTVKTNDGCWLFNGQLVKKDGHGVLMIKGKIRLVHRLAWEMFIGPIPEGKCVLHNCVGHPNCWNPDHLRIGTVADNNRDTLDQGRHGTAKITHQIAREIRGNTEGFSYRQIAEMYGISLPVVYNIRAGKTWNRA